MRRACRVAIALLLLLAPALSAQPRTEYRGFWVETFNSTPLNNQGDVDAVVSKAVAAKANVIFAQVRRRGDAWYLKSLEPAPDATPIEPGFDALQALIDTAHAAGIELHAYVIVGAVWNKNPTVTGGLPTSANHVFNLHGGYDPAARKIVAGPNNWLTRTLLPDSGTAIAFQGHRFGSDFWIDLGHPDAEAYTVDVLMHLVRNYDIDGLHIDLIRYPEFSASGQTRVNGTNIGYNPTSVARFQWAKDRVSTSVPETGDPEWMQWRRDQVTNFVRRLYLNSIAVRPQLKLSASLIVFGGVATPLPPPAPQDPWVYSEAYWRVYQDWRAWTEEGIVDIAIPMNYKRESAASEVGMLNAWNEWTKDHAYNRATMIGLGGYLNGVEGSLRQVRRSLAPSSAGNSTSGVTFFSMATTNVAFPNASPSMPATNPWAIPPGSTPLRSFDEFRSALTTGRSLDGTRLYEDLVVNPSPIFAETADIPVFSWKTNPVVGHIMGFIKDADGRIVDSGSVSIARVSVDPATAGHAALNTATDGGGFYGGVDLAPGRYQVTVTPVRQDPYTHQCTVDVAPGQVSSLDFTVDRNAPSVTASSTRDVLWPPNGEIVDVALVVTAADRGVGLSSLQVSVTDEYGLREPQVTTPATGTDPFEWTPTLRLEASRLGEDLDGRTYTVTITAADRACNVSTSTLRVVVPHDQRTK
jgi:uncharacterized lipoprotein YddW (UPF0748 family)